MNSVQEVVLAYATAFEVTYEDDDWERLRPYFAADAVYEVVGGPMACRIEGADNILRGLKKSVDGFDRQLDSRRIDLPAAPVVEGDTLKLQWVVTYTRDDSPPGELLGRSEATVRDGVIVELRDFYDDAELAPFGEWLARHAPDLDGTYV